MTCPPRALVSEPFACQVETVERALIEVQSQPLSYYGRRGNNTNTAARNLPQMGLSAASHSLMGPANMGSLLNPHVPGQQTAGKPGHGAGAGAFFANSKYGFYAPNNQRPQTHQNPPPAMDVYGNTYRGASGPSGLALGGSPAAAGFHVPLGAGGLTPHIPQVFNDEKVFVGGAVGNLGDSPALMDAKKQDALATFDPFGSEFSGQGSHGLLFLPMFSSPRQILGSAYSSTSSNIWGNSGKSMTGDAAVWG
ncbi:hypothetical protein METBIDRAFT_199779 [Metschnikowia bicuspidata var. bicuspidata NRRL YB-4993]|uniref:Uncharacterized protein n=1 Tax=Metschnikowia bicuspidata var. bicuspidata NRRL YB-4993 TaxID=869754 RepID=A0A1A0H8N6_9ASCO|nr:hypothetical protein METBIDRAFT_199779 [Metschnikowia bicuspidata var. bicuspidata NRRL YB-4993]OBA20479.1 hypothetical protein METBIDRAFT_199779 [Metschnikowia bicuspidata var. bicuspidata NRRL YB-4993]